MPVLCIICTDLYDNFQDIVAVPCGHVFHSKCLFHWFDQSKTCPECRRSVSIKNVIKLYFNVSANNNSLDFSELANEVESLKAEVKLKEREIEKGKVKHEQLQSYVAKYESEIECLQQVQYSQEMEMRSLKLRVETSKHMESKCQKLSQKVVALTNDMEHFNNVQEIVTGSQEDAEKILRDCAIVCNENEYQDSAKKLATYCSVMKRELKRIIDKNSTSNNEMKDLKKSLGFHVQSFKKEKTINKKLEAKVADLELEISKLLSEKENKCSSNSITPNTSLCQSLPSTSKPCADSFVMTPISVNMDENKKRKIELIVLDKEIGKISVPSHAANFTFKKSLKLKHQTRTEMNDSILKIGYNGLGGHGRFIRNAKSIAKP